ncbi:MAG TPA: hypothetical protein VHF22_11890 [Planctomycetota bacterium]|nr:hypothetical protein [Planctomycetota bacterium]
MPPFRGPAPEPKPEAPRAVPPSEVTAFIDPDRIDRLLAPWVADARDRAFVVRCLLGEGPAHHRGANYVLLALLGLLLPPASPGGAAPPALAADDGAVPVPLRLPPHLADGVESPDFPLRMPTAPLELLAPRASSAFAAMIDCLVDGPPQHALANAAMVALLGRLLGSAAPLAASPGRP